MKWSSSFSPSFAFLPLMFYVPLPEQKVMIFSSFDITFVLEPRTFSSFTGFFSHLIQFQHTALLLVLVSCSYLADLTVYKCFSSTFFMQFYHRSLILPLWLHLFICLFIYLEEGRQHLPGCSALTTKYHDATFIPLPCHGTWYKAL